MHERRLLGTISLLISFGLSACANVEKGGPNERWESASQAGAKAAKAGDYKVAERHYSKAVQEALHLGDNDPHLVQSLNDLASTFAQEKRLGEAQVTYLAVLKRQEHLFGADAPQLVPTLNNIVRVTCAGGKCGSALPYLERLLSIRKKSLGLYHPDSLLTLQLIGETYEKEGKLDKALDYFQQEVSAKKKLLGRQNLVVVSSSMNVVRVLKAQGDYARAEKLLKEMLDTEEKYDLGRSQLVDSTIKSYQDLLRRTGRATEATRLTYRSRRKAA
jgi:tetratricopeptide (TPR) repeat protein